MNEIPEMLKGLTDIPLAALSVVFGIILLKKNIKSWSTLFFLVGISAVLGTVVHVVNVSKILYFVIWIVLYGFLFESIRTFTYLMTRYISAKNEREKTAVLVLEIILYFIAVILLFIPDIQDIYALVVFMILMMIRLIFCALRTKKVPGTVAVLFVLLIVPIALQACADFVPYAVVAEHIVLIAALSTAFLIALNQKKKM